MANVSRRTSREDLDQIAIFEWISFHPEIVKDAHHIANQGKRSVMEHMKLRKMGFTKGFSDIFIAVPTPRYHGLFIELKSLDKRGIYGKPTIEQLEFIRRKNERGYLAIVCKGVDNAINAIKSYLS